MSRLKVLASLAWLAVLPGCAHSPTVLGVAPEGSPLSLAEVIKAPSSSVATVRGKMVEKCPVAGCWFDVRDGSGTLHVDTKNAGFVVLDVPLQTDVTVRGRVEHQGSETLLDATGMSY